jgi:hypothetical protein
MTEQYAGTSVATIDTDFRLYRRHRRDVVPTVMPH